MPYRNTIFATGEYYHVFNRGVAYLPIFNNTQDYDRFVMTLSYYRFKDPPVRLSKLLQQAKDVREQMIATVEKNNNKNVEVAAYCLMPNHFHLLLKQVSDGGVSKYMRLAINSYAKYFNTKNKRVGSLFQDMFKAVRIESDEQFLHISRYIHINPLVSYLVQKEELLRFPWSSFPSYAEESNISFVDTMPILANFKNRNEYIQFVFNQEDYGKKLKEIKHLMFEDE